MNDDRRAAADFRAPPPQDNLQRATQAAYDAISGQSEEQLRWLGAEPAGGAWRLAVLNDAFVVEWSARRITTEAGAKVGPHWTILALHYLAIRDRPEDQTPSVTFADLSSARSYASVYQQRVIGRLCATAGRDAETLRAASVGLGGRAASAGDVVFDFQPFLRLALRLIWHAPDDEFPASATLLLPANIESFFCSEDIVVLSECLVARLGGRPF